MWWESVKLILSMKYFAPNGEISTRVAPTQLALVWGHNERLWNFWAQYQRQHLHLIKSMERCWLLPPPETIKQFWLLSLSKYYENALWTLFVWWNSTWSVSYAIRKLALERNTRQTRTHTDTRIHTDYSRCQVQCSGVAVDSIEAV